MKEKMSTFQMVFYGVLIVAIIAGVLIFSVKRQNASNVAAPVTIWGILDQTIIENYALEINNIVKNSVNVIYTEIPSDVFESKLIEALASGNGPDAILVKDDLLIKHENKLYNILYDSYPQKTFKDTFIEAGDILLKADGISGFPFMIDPLVMYWNRSTLNAGGISIPPKYWDEFLKIVPGLVRKDSSFNISKTAVALGEFRNIKNAKEILTTLIMQAGNPIVTRNLSGNQDESKFLVGLESRQGYAVSPAGAAVSFFTQFSNPSKTLYSWNRALPNSEDMFLAGNLAFYFGFASEYPTLRRKNPNLNFDVAILPQSRSSDAKFTHGDLYFIGIMKNSPNINGAFNSAAVLTSTENMKIFSNLINLPPVRRDLLVEQNSSAIMQNFNLSALIAKPFFDPDDIKTSKIFSDMIESYTSGRSDLPESIQRAQSELELLTKLIQP